jgi:hypothetical protein
MQVALLVAAEVEEYVPAAQFWQVLLLVAPSTDENVPAGQAMHSDWLDDA